MWSNSSIYLSELVLECAHDHNYNSNSRLQQSVEGSAALVITRPPEIVSVLRIATEEARPIFVTFDSHPRKKHPDGAAFIFHPSLGAAAVYLSDLLQFDARILSDPNLQWQAQLLAHCSAHMFIARETPTSPSELHEVLLEASLGVLKLKAEVSDLTSRIRALDSDNRHLAEENTDLEAKVEDLQEENRRLVRKAAFSTTNGTSASAVHPSPANGSWAGSPSLRGPSLGQQSSHPSQKDPNSKGKLVFKTIEEYDEDDAIFATRIELEWRSQVDDKASLDLAYRQQQKFEDEDRRLRAQLEELRQAAPATFECGICLEEQTESMVCQVDPCGHKFCRYLSQRCRERRQRSSRTPPGTVYSRICGRNSASIDSQYSAPSVPPIGVLVSLGVSRCIPLSFEKQD